MSRLILSGFVINNAFLKQICQQYLVHGKVPPALCSTTTAVVISRQYAKRIE